jgi:hypothetical protein
MMISARYEGSALRWLLPENAGGYSSEERAALWALSERDTMRCPLLTRGDRP